MAQQDINNLKNRATVIKTENQDGANTADRVGGLLYDIIDTFGGMIGSGISSGLNNPLAAINSANLGNPSGDKILPYQNSIWKYIDIPTGVGTVDWNNITNKPDLTGLNYLPDTTRYGSSLAIDGNTITLKDASNAALSSINLGNSSLVYYGTDTLPDRSTTQSSITAGDIRLSKSGSSDTVQLWSTNNGTLMFGNSPVSGIQWGENTVPDVSIQPKIIIKGDLYVEKEDGSNLGGKVQADNLALFTTQIDEDNNLSYVYRSICLTGGELSFDGFNLTVPDGEGGHKLNIDESILIPDDLHLNGNHLYLWNTVNETTIGSGVELPTAGGGGGSSDVIGLPAGSISNGTRVNVSTNKLEVGTASLHNGGSVQGNVLDIRSSDDLRKALCIIDSDNNINFATFFRNSTEDSWTVQTDAKNLKINGHIIGGGTGGGITNVKIAGSAASIQDNYALIPKAGIMQYGVIQIGAYRDAEVTCESVGSLSTTQNYQLQMDNTGKTFVHVPWTSGSGITSGTWAAFFNEKSKGSSDTTGYLYLSNDGVSLQGSTGGLTWTDLNSYDTDSNKIINYSHIPIAQDQKIGGISTGYTSSGNSFALNVDQQHGQGYVTVSKEVFVSSISIQNLCTAFENSTGVLVRKKYNATSQEFDFWVASLYTNTVPDGTYYISTGTGSSTGAAIVKLVISSSRTSFNLSVLVNSHPYYWSFTSEGVKINNSISVTETSTRAIYNSVANKINAIEGNNVIQTISSGNPTETVSNAPNVTLYVPLT